MNKVLFYYFKKKKKKIIIIIIIIIIILFSSSFPVFHPLLAGSWGVIREKVTSVTVLSLVCGMYQAL